VSRKTQKANVCKAFTSPRKNRFQQCAEINRIAKTGVRPHKHWRFCLHEQDHYEISGLEHLWRCSNHKTLSPFSGIRLCFIVPLALGTTDENHYRQRLLQGRDLFFGHQRPGFDANWQNRISKCGILRRTQHAGIKSSIMVNFPDPALVNMCACKTGPFLTRR